MTSVFRVLFPVLLLLGLGALLRVKRVFSDQGVSELKFLLTKIILPAAIFHALATASYTDQVWELVAIMLVMMALSFALGYLLRPLLGGPFQKYVPFMVSVYEGGMIAYPLYVQLCGSENLSRIALLDIAGLLFGFSVYMSLLTFTESGEKPSAKKLSLNAVRNPAFVAAVLGVAAGTSGLGAAFLRTDAGSVYAAAMQALTAPLSAMILLIVGYSIRLEKRLIQPCLKTIALRFAVQALMAVLVLFALHRLVGRDRLTDLAVLIYMSAPATFSMQSFVRDEDGGSYVSTSNALYCLISVAVYAAAALL